MGIWGVVVLGVVTCGVVCGAASSNQQYCPDLKPQRTLELDQMTGMWYAVEIVQHHYIPNKHDTSLTLDICPILHLTRDTPDSIRLLWKENAGLVEYNFNIPVKSSPGFWIATTRQNGSLTTEKNYIHFSGTAQVMKAVGTHMVLTMCSRQEGQVLSVLMSRERNIRRQEIISVNNMLQRRGLAMSYIRETCRSAANALGLTLHQGLLVLVLIVITRVASIPRM